MVALCLRVCVYATLKCRFVFGVAMESTSRIFYPSGAAWLKAFVSAPSRRIHCALVCQTASVFRGVCLGVTQAQTFQHSPATALGVWHVSAKFPFADENNTVRQWSDPRSCKRYARSTHGEFNTFHYKVMKSLIVSLLSLIILNSFTGI